LKVDNKTGLFFANDTPQILTEDSIVSLMLRFNKAMFDHGVPPTTLVRDSRFGIVPMLEYYSYIGQKTYSSDINEQFILATRHKYEAGEIKQYMWKHSRRIAVLLSRYVDTGIVDLKSLSPWGLRQPIPQFKELLDGFVKDLKLTGAVADSTMRISWSAVRGLLFAFEDSGITDINQVGYKEFSNCITSLSAHYRGGLGKMVYCVNLFSKYLYKTEIVQFDFTRAVPQFPEYRKHSIEGFTNDEILRILDSVDISTPIGKRDYAIFVLAAQTSLRAVDIAKIKRMDIDWHKNELRVVQAKTGQGIIYPLLPESGNAVADYLLHGRPTSGEPFVFVTHQGIPHQLEASSLIARLYVYMQKAGIEKGKRAFHSFRRTVATNLLDNEVSLEMMQQITGQNDFSSVKPYLSINEKGLKQCSLSFPSREVS